MIQAGWLRGSLGCLVPVFWLPAEFGVDVVGSEGLAIMVFLFTVRLTKQPQGFLWLFFVFLGPPCTTAVPVLKANSGYNGE